MKRSERKLNILHAFLASGLLLTVALAAFCGQPAQTLTLAEAAVSTGEVPEEPSVIPSEQATSAPSEEPAATAVPSPDVSATATLTPSPSPTAEPTSTPTPAPTPTPTPTPTPEPVPSPLPAVEQHVNSARIGLKFGSSALSVFTTGSASGGTLGVANGSANYTPILTFTASNTVSARPDSGYHIIIGSRFTSAEAARKEMLKVSELMEGAGTSLLYLFDGTYWNIGAGFYQNYPAPGVNDVTGRDRYTLLSERLSGAGYALSVCSVGVNSIKTYVDGSPVLILNTAGTDWQVRVTPLAASGSLPPLLKLGGGTYRGYFDVHRYKGGNLILINDVNVEDYLYSVVPSEMIPGTASGWEKRKEGLMAQAILARTVAYEYIISGRTTSYGYHMDDTTNYQVYSGYTKQNGDAAEFENTTRATDLTAGMVLIYNGELCHNVYYHGNNGGYTEITENVWGGTRPAYIVSVPDPWTPSYPWTRTFTGASISSAAVSYTKNTLGVDIGTLKYITVSGRAESGRVIELIFEGSDTDAIITKLRTRTAFSLVGQLYWFDVEETYSATDGQGKTVEMLSSRARKYLEGDIYSTRILPESYALKGSDGYLYERIHILGANDPRTVTITGNGHGHAVGMSQDGAEEMSKAGIPYTEIIEFYMPGMTVDNVSRLLK